MEIDLIVEECTEPGEFMNFSIREYVTEMRSKDPTKCWPFGSLGDPDDCKIFVPYQSSESTSLSTQFFPSKICDSDDTPEHKEAANSPEVDVLSGKEDQPPTATDMIKSLEIDNKVGKDIYDESSELTCSKVTNGQCRHKNSVDEDAKIGSSVASDNIGPESRRKPRRYRLLSDIYRDPASEMGAHCDITNPVNVNHKFFAETEDERDDDVTLYELFRKQKGVQVTDPTVKKRRMVQVEEQRVDHGRKLKRKFRDTSVSDLEVGPESHLCKKTIIDDTESKTMAKGCTVKASSLTIIPKNEGATSWLGSKENAFLKQKDFHLPCRKKANRREATESPNEDFEMEAVMLLAYHFKKENSSANGEVLHEPKTNTTCAHVHKNIQEHSIPSVQKSITKTSSVLSADKQKTFIKEKLEDVFCSAKTKDHSKGTNASVVQAHMETCMMKAAGVDRDAQNCSILLCSLNRNPADFSIPNAKNKFMRSCKEVKL